jgi:hypothetical protein
MITTRHMNASIEGLLGLRNSQLSRLIGGNGSEIRKELKQRLAKGEKYIPCSEDCEGFDPVTGCPGHEEKIINDAE